ncbi:MAG: hypothetical protein ABI880_11475, partial [Acidobacteriota bacterium]
MRLPAFVSVLVLGLSATALPASAQPAGSEVAYRFHYAAAGDATVTISLEWSLPLEGPRALVMPRAIPMGYGEQRYDAFVSDVTATSTAGA